MHHNEIKVQGQTFVELLELATKLGPAHVAALNEQVTRQTLEENSK